MQIHLPRQVRTAASGAAAVSALLLTACATVNPHHDPAKPHHRPDGFRNLHTDFEPKGLRTLLQWQWDAVRNGLPKPPLAPTPVVEPDLAFLHANARRGSEMSPTLTWIGHATGSAIADPRRFGMDFMIVALAAAMATAFWRGRASLAPAGVALAVALAVHAWMPGGWTALAAGLAGAGTAWMLHDDER